MTKEELLAKIRTAFKDVRLEDGVGLWEAQGLDEYAGDAKMRELRAKDERDDWGKMPYKDLAYCYSSLSFFDAKGMRFCLPQFLVFDLLSDDLTDHVGLPDVVFTLGHKLNEEYQMERFSLFDAEQIQCVIDFLEYKLPETYDEDGLRKTIGEWRKKLKS